jgi:tight adherence protein B
MQKWIYLFGSFGIVYGAAVILWWRIQAEKRREQVVRNLASKVDPGGSVRTTVLIDEQSRAAGLAGMLRAGRSAARAGHIDKFSKSRFLLLTLVGAFAGFLVGTKLVDYIGVLAPVIGAFVGGAIPRMYRAKHRDKRLAAIEDQFPDSLDFLARSVRAGNAFSIALEMLGAEASEPLKSEVLKVTREMALGANLEDALHGLIARIPLLEIRMFVAAVLLQRETGGNLSEVLGKLAISVRERLRLQGQVMAASGQGRLTAKILTFLPVVLLGILEVISPAYLNNLTREPLGRNLLGIAIVSQIMGYLVMQRMIKVEV